MGKIDLMLQVENLRTYFLKRGRPPLRAVNGVSYNIKPGEMAAIVGESGCGKSISVLSLIRLNPPTSTIVGGRILWHGRDVLGLTKEELFRIRGKEIAMIFQNPLSSLNPLMTVGHQISEAFQIHQGLTKRESLQKSEQMLELVAVPDIKSKMKAYPFQLSGGMRQRVMAAIALSCSPKLLIADEPTTALDATTQAQLLELLVSANKEVQRATVLVTHDLGIVARYADTVHIMYAGYIVESASCEEIYAMPLHPYTEVLIKAVPRLDNAGRFKLSPIDGHPPRLDNLGTGCPFAPRCLYAFKRCSEELPPLQCQSPGHSAACWRL